MKNQRIEIMADFGDLAAKLKRFSADQDDPAVAAEIAVVTEFVGDAEGLFIETCNNHGL